jgi:hypothetical protein
MLRSWRLRVGTAAVDGQWVDLEQGHLLVVLREGDEVPGATDWEVTLVTDPPRPVRPGRHALRLGTVDGHEVAGPAVVRFSDGARHLLRGDGPLDGVLDALD